VSQYAEATSRVSKIFNIISDSYDASGVDFFQPIAAGLVSALGTSMDESWLDMGCGKGAIAEQAAASIKSLLGVDISERMIENAQAMARRKQISNATFILGDAQDPGQLVGEFDVISSCLVLFFLPDPLTAVTRWRRLLKDSGRIGVTTFGSNDSRWAAVDEIFMKYQPPQTLDARTSGTQGWFSSDAEMERLLSEAGYRDVRTVEQSLPVYFQDRDKWHAFSWSTGQRAMWMRVPEDQRPSVRDEIYSLLETFLEPDGSFTFHQGIRHTLAVK
jgi:ubiquinone/menaquinone biosynthesis C-methylase UbiE